MYQGHPLTIFGADAALHHIGLAVQRIEDVAIPELVEIEDKNQGVRIAFVRLEDCCVELLEPMDKSSPVAGSLKKNNKLLHICFEVNNLEEAIRSATSYGFRVIHSPVGAVAFGGRTICWIFSPVWGLIEILERGKKI